MPRINFKLVKPRIKNKRCFKQGAFQCKMAGSGFHVIAKLTGPFYRGVEFCTGGCSKCLYHLADFFLHSNICLGDKTEKQDCDVGAYSRSSSDSKCRS
jgi:hypothetical protein